MSSDRPDNIIRLPYGIHQIPHLVGGKSLFPFRSLNLHSRIGNSSGFRLCINSDPVETKELPEHIAVGRTEAAAFAPMAMMISDAFSDGWKGCRRGPLRSNTACRCNVLLYVFTPIGIPGTPDFPCPVTCFQSSKRSSIKANSSSSVR